jgi:hypothetical protein
MQMVLLKKAIFTVNKHETILKRQHEEVSSQDRAVLRSPASDCRRLPGT